MMSLSALINSSVLDSGSNGGGSAAETEEVVNSSSSGSGGRGSSSNSKKKVNGGSGAEAEEEDTDVYMLKKAIDILSWLKDVSVSNPNEEKQEKARHTSEKIKNLMGKLKDIGERFKSCKSSLKEKKDQLKFVEGEVIELKNRVVYFEAQNQLKDGVIGFLRREVDVEREKRIQAEMTLELKGMILTDPEKALKMPIPGEEKEEDDTDLMVSSAPCGGAVPSVNEGLPQQQASKKGSTQNGKISPLKRKLSEDTLQNSKGSSNKRTCKLRKSERNIPAGKGKHKQQTNKVEDQDTSTSCSSVSTEEEPVPQRRSRRSAAAKPSTDPPEKPTIDLVPLEATTSSGKPEPEKDDSRTKIRVKNDETDEDESSESASDSESFSSETDSESEAEMIRIRARRRKRIQSQRKRKLNTTIPKNTEPGGSLSCLCGNLSQDSQDNDANSQEQGQNSQQCEKDASDEKCKVCGEGMFFPSYKKVKLTFNNNTATATTASSANTGENEVLDLSATTGGGKNGLRTPNDKNNEDEDTQKRQKSNSNNTPISDDKPQKVTTSGKKKSSKKKKSLDNGLPPKKRGRPKKNSNKNSKITAAPPVPATTKTETEENERAQVYAKNRESHHRINHPSGFACKCGSTYSNDERLKYHLMFGMFGDVFKCPVSECGISFRQFVVHKKHALDEHGVEIMGHYGCLMCSLHFESLKGLKDHYKECIYKPLLDGAMNVSNETEKV